MRSHVSRWYYSLLLGAALTLSVPTMVRAQSLTSSISGNFKTTNVFYSDTGSFNPTPVTDTSLLQQTMTVSDTSVDPSDGSTVANAGGTARAQTQYGINSVFARATVNAGFDNSLFTGVSASADVKSSSVWQDSIVVDKAGLTGTTGTLNYSFAVAGSISGNLNSSYKAQRSFVVKQNGSTIGTLTTNLSNGTYNETLTISSISFVYGQAFTLSAALSAEAQRIEDTIETPQTSKVDYQNGATFTSFSVFDGSGAQVNGATYSAASGTTSYNLIGGTAALVPESSTVLLISIALIVGSAAQFAIRRRTSL